MKKVIYIACTILTFYGLNSCNKNETGTAEKFYNHYFPVQAGNWIEYQIDSIHHDITSDSTSYFLREEFSDFDTNQYPTSVLQLKRFIRKNTLDKWLLKEVWLVEQKDNSIEVVEENRRFVKIVFPIRLSKSWDGNIYNELEAENYKITSVHSPYSNLSGSYDSTITVEHRLRVNLVDSIIASERYATNIGLIEKIDINLDFGSGKRKGYEFRKKITAYKN